MRAHAAFVPTLVLERLAADPRAPAEPYETSFPAAVMFVDIAGYVRLSGATHRSVARRETRMEVQSRGLRRKSSGRWRRRTSDDANPDSRVAGLAGEAMRDVVSACFAAIVEMVSRHGGDVVKFAGDALFVAWPAGPDRREDRSIVRTSRPSRPEEDDENVFSQKKEKKPATRDETLGETALRAVQCGLAIQASKHKALKHLRLKLVIGAGRLRGLNVGGVDDRWEYAVAGEPVSQIARCARFAAPGEVVVSPECASLEEMQDHAEFEPVWGPSVGSDEEDVVSSDDGSASENDAYLSNKKTKKRVRVGAFRFPSARKWEKLFAGAPETRETRDAGDATFAFPGAFRSRAPWSRMRSGTSTRSRRSHRSAWTDRESNGSNRTPNPEPLRVARLTNGFDGATVAAAISPPRPSADRDAMLRDVLRLFRDTRNDTISGPGPDIRQARMVDPADALVKALERYVPAPARFGGYETKRGEAKKNARASSARVGADRRTPRVSRLYDVAWRGEIRRCAVVFLDARLPEIPASFCNGADADGTTYDGTNAEFSSESAGGEEALLRHAQTAVASIQNSLKTHGGALRQFLVDDKGSVAIAVFGLPSMSHADDARRAVAFAAEVVAALEAGGLAGGRAGIATGDAFCGAVGPETRCEYAVYGDCVNVAARLMTLSSRSDVSGSKSSVLACESTRDACGDAVAFDAGTPVRLKGKKGTTLAFAPSRGVSRRRGDDVATDALGFESERRPFESNRPRWTRTRRGDGIGPIGRTSTSSVRLDIDALEPRARELVVTAAAFSEAFDAETLLAAAAGVADSCSRHRENDETSAGSPPRDFATRDDVDALVRAGIFRVTNTGDERKRAEDPCSSDSSEDFSDASVSRVTVSFASPDETETETEKRRSVVASGKNKPRVAARDTERASLAFASGRVRDAALSMLTDAARRPASRAVASHLESSLNQETRNALRARNKKKKRASLSLSLAPVAATSGAPNAFFEDAALLADVAAHWTAAGRRARARRCLALAGEKELARGTRGAAVCAAGLFAEALRLCEPPSPPERRLSDAKKSLFKTKKRLRREAFLARRAGAARRAAGHGEAAERLVRDAIDTLESLEFRREGNACACAVSALLFRAKPGPANRTRTRQKKKTRGRMTRRDATETDDAFKNGNVSPGTSSSSTDCSYDSAEADAELALARLALFEITGATADAARAVRAAEACEGNAAASLFLWRTDGFFNARDATKNTRRAKDLLRDARVAVANSRKHARRKSAFFSFPFQKRFSFSVRDDT